MANGYYEEVEGLQGSNHTYYAGEVMSFSSVEPARATPRTSSNDSSTDHAPALAQYPEPWPIRRTSAAGRGMESTSLAGAGMAMG
jgi:hypothetical protein